MTWNRRGTWIITKEETTIPLVFKSQVITQVSNLSNIKPTWYWAGYLIQCLTIPPIGLVRIEKKIDVPIKDSSLFTPEKFKPNYQLKFHKADWIESLRLTIYEDSMPLNFEPIVNIPSTTASTASGFTIPISATSVSLAATNPNRKKLVIANNTNQDLYVDFDTAASIADHCVKIPRVTPGGFIATYELDGYTGVVSGIWAAAGTGAALIRELA